MKKRMALWLLAFLLFGVKTALADTGIGIKAGTLGIGVEGYQSLNDHFSITLGVNSFSFSRSFTDNNDEGDSSGDTVDVSLNMLSVAVMTNYHPATTSWWRGFRITAGVMYNGNEGSLKNEPTGTIEIGDKEYSSDEITAMTGSLSFGKFAPYLGIGWGQVGGRRWGFNWDLGVMFQGSTNVELAVQGPKANDADVQAELEKERQDLEEEVGGVLRYWPVVALGLHFRF